MKIKLKVTYSVALVMAFLMAENKIRELKDLPQADFRGVPERFLLSLRTNAITDNFVYWKLGLLLGFIVIQGMFSSWVHTYLRSFIRRLSILLFSFFNKVDFSCHWRAIMLINMIDKIIHSYLLIWNFSSRFQLDIYARPYIIVYS